MDENQRTLAERLIMEAVNKGVERQRRRQVRPTIDTSTPSSQTSGSPQSGTSQRQRRQQVPAIARSTTASTTSGSPEPGTSHAVMTQRPTTPPPDSRRPRTPTPPSTPPFRHSSSSPGSAPFSPEANIPLSRSLGWEISTSGSDNEEPASLLQPPTVRELLARQLRLERTAALLQQTAALLQAQVEQQGVTLLHLLGRGRR
ncbi:histone H3.v1-like [Ranitomeya imitator]|uniref:histone H3.v1-like n=1 Tax=Ranitomeya imitator TaxID=111125 RepID=UPI0037E96A43